MEQYNMRANFYPAKEPVNGYIGHADLAISNIIRIQGIAVFDNAEKGGLHIQFPSFGDNNTSYVTPHSPEAFGQMMDVIEKAIADEKHFGHVAGKPNPQLSVTGQVVNEPYADGRFALQIGDICTIYGITTEQVNYSKDGKEVPFVAVNAPSLRPFEKDGEMKYPPVFKGLVSIYEANGETKKTDYGQVIRAMVIAERSKLMKPPLEKQMETATAQKGGKKGTKKKAPAKETQR